MLQGAVIAVVVPAYDEARWISGVIATMPPLVDHVVVVDDASRDETAAIVQREVERANGPGRVHLVRQAANCGVGAAICVGYRHAAQLGADVVAVMAGDGQMDPEELPTVLLPVVEGRADYVKGDRLRYPGVEAIMPRARRWGSGALGVLTSLAVGRRVHDSQCGYTAISREAITRLPLETIWPRYGYPNDLIAAVCAAGLRLEEVVVRPVYGGQASGLRPWHVLTILRLLVRSRLRR